MNVQVFTLLAVACYCFAALRVAQMMSNPEIERNSSKQRLLLPGAAAAMLHGIALSYALLGGEAGVNLSITNAASLVAWLVVCLLLVATISKPLENLAVVLLPLAGLSLIAQWLLPGTRLVASDTPIGLQVHIGLSVIAYSVLTIAAVQALMIATGERQLRNKGSLVSLSVLPPLQTMEDLLFQLIWLGFSLLSLGLLSGFMFVEDLPGQHLTHKTILSCLGWLVFAILLWGRHRSGWRGRTAVRYTLSGFGLLALAFFGTEIVLQLILHRV
jgi:ABC-type uncharacterized transport system permease subunit